MSRHILLRLGLALTLALAGCAPARKRASAPPRMAAVRADEPQERQPPGWPPYYPPRLVRDLAGTDAVTGEAAVITRGYVLHRVDVEKIRVMQVGAERCTADLDACEQRVVRAAAPPGFWARWEGRMLLLGLGLVAGTGMTMGLVIAVD
jgi:hypothetical protein